MEFITSGDRIATENFSIGKIYTVTFTNGNYFINTCVGIGPDFVMFQQEAPKMLFCLDMESAETISSIDESGGGAGTMNYNELENKPSINGVILIGNKTAADLSILPVPIVGENDNNKILTASYSGGVGSYSWQPAPSSGTTDYTQLTNKPQINSVELSGNKSLADLGIASAEALAGKQDVISDLSTIRSGAAAGATAVQPATLANYQTLIDSTHKLSSDLVDDTGHTNKFATAAQLAQIETNKTNILFYQENGSKNALDCTLKSLKALNNGWTDNVCNQNGVYYTVNDDGSISVSGTSAAGDSYFKLSNGVNIGSCKMTGCPSGGGAQRYMIYAATPDKADTGSGNTYTGNSGSVYIIVRTAMGAVSDLTFKPMISPSDMDTAYQQYAPSNAELYAMIQALQS